MKRIEDAGKQGSILLLPSLQFRPSACFGRIGDSLGEIENLEGVLKESESFSFLYFKDEYDNGGHGEERSCSGTGSAASHTSCHFGLPSEVERQRWLRGRRKTSHRLYGFRIP